MDSRSHYDQLLSAVIYIYKKNPPLPYLRHQAPVQNHDKKPADLPFSPCASTASPTPETMMRCSASPASVAPFLRPPELLQNKSEDVVSIHQHRGCKHAREKKKKKNSRERFKENTIKAKAVESSSPSVYPVPFILQHYAFMDGDILPYDAAGSGLMVYDTLSGNKARSILNAAG